jgi:hypothetical protein
MTSVSPEEQDAAPAEVEVWVGKDLYEAALERARQQGQTLAGQARAALYAAAAEAKVPREGWVVIAGGGWNREVYATEAKAQEVADSMRQVLCAEDPDLEIDLEIIVDHVLGEESRRVGADKLYPRPYKKEKRKLIRLRMPQSTKDATVKRIHDSGESIQSAVERFLRVYVDKGTIVAKGKR